MFSDSYHKNQRNIKVNLQSSHGSYLRNHELYIYNIYNSLCRMMDVLFSWCRLKIPNKKSKICALMEVKRTNFHSRNSAGCHSSTKLTARRNEDWRQVLPCDVSYKDKVSKSSRICKALKFFRGLEACLMLGQACSWTELFLNQVLKISSAAEGWPQSSWLHSGKTSYRLPWKKKHVQHGIYFPYLENDHKLPEWATFKTLLLMDKIPHHQGWWLSHYL